MMNTSVLIPITLKKASPPMANIPIAIPIEPIISRILRPYLSTVIIATTVKITLISPITTVCSIDESFAAPMLSKIRGA